MSDSSDTQVQAGDVWRYAHDGANYTIVRRHEDGHGWRFGDGRGDHFSDGAFGHVGPFGLMLISRRAPEAKHPERVKGMRYHDTWNGTTVTVIARIKCPHGQCANHWTANIGGSWCAGAFGDDGRTSPRLVSIDTPGTPAEPSARACLKPRWCDHEVGASSCPRYQAWMEDRGCDQVYSKDEARRYCSTTCRDRLPPLSAQGKPKRCCNVVDCQIFRPHDHGIHEPPTPATKPAESVKAERLFLVTTCGVRFRAELHAEYATHLADCRTCKTRQLPPEPIRHEPMCHPGTCGPCDIEFAHKGRRRPMIDRRPSHVAALSDDDLLAGEGCGR